MRKITALISSIIIATGLFVAPMMTTNPVFADDCYDGAIIDSCDDGKGSGINDTLDFVVNIMSIGIGILGVIGITIVGIQYLTAGGNEEQTRKAKRRLFEIVIGLVAYALIFALLKWLLPNFK